MASVGSGVVGSSVERQASTTLNITSLQDLTIIEAWGSDAESSKYVTFYHVTSTGELYFGESSKQKMSISLNEYRSALQRVSDDEIYPKIPEGTRLTVAPEALDDTLAYFKRTGLVHYESMRGTGFVPKALLDEVLVMEQISKASHPNIVGYYGCRVNRGRITAIVLERLGQTLEQYAAERPSLDLDIDRFFKDLKSAVDCLHSMGLAHNDINPRNIMVKNGSPVVIDFDSCQPVGARLQSLGTTGWYEEEFYTSEKKHDTYSLGKLQEWLQAQKRKGTEEIDKKEVQEVGRR